MTGSFGSRIGSGMESRQLDTEPAERGGDKRMINAMNVGGNMCCHQCGRELPEWEEPEPYPWGYVEGELYCLDCG